MNIAKFLRTAFFFITPPVAFRTFTLLSDIAIVFSRVGTPTFLMDTFWVPPLSETNLKSHPPLYTFRLNSVFTGGACFG